MSENESTTIEDKCNPPTDKTVASSPYSTCGISQIYVVELEGYRVGKRLYIKEICLLHLNGHVYNHRFCKIPIMPKDRRLTNYIYNHCHGIPLNLKDLDKSLPRLPAKSLLITHGLEKQGLLQRLYPHCLALTLASDKSYDKLLTTRHRNLHLHRRECPLLRHGPGCAFVKAHKLLEALLLSSNDGVF